MTTRFLAAFALLVILAAQPIPLAADELGTQGVSPGAIDRITRVEAKCPAFSWQSDPAAEHYEIVVYRLDENLVDVQEADLETATVVLYQEIPGRTTSWTPELADCFGPGERFVWFVRAVLDANTGEGTEWSDPRFFEVASAPSADELERAIEVIRMWEAATGDGSPTLSADAASDAAADAAADAVTVADSGTGSGSTRTKSVVTGTAAIRGEQPDASGETYGVVGTSASPDGAGIGAANTAGGPDLVLDGAVPAEISESGVDRPSASAQTFSITNTGGGGMTLTIEDVPVVTIESDQDTLAALAPCPDSYVPKWNGTSWVCAPDLDTDTLAGLAPCATGEVAKWIGSTWDCAPDADTLAALNCGRNEIAKWNDAGSVWECAADSNTTYSFGQGLMIDNGQIVIDPSAFVPRITTLDSTGDVGQFSSLAIGSDGLGIISYFDGTDPLNGKLKVAHCNDVPCTTAAISLIDDLGSQTIHGNTSVDTSIAIDSQGRALISYIHDEDELRVAYCDDIPCTSAAISTIDSGAAYSVSVAIGNDGLGLISYYKSGLNVAHCTDAACTSATITTLDSGDYLGLENSITIGTDGLGLISYFDDTAHPDGDLKVAHCDNLLCTSATLSTPDSSSSVGDHTSIAIGSDGLGLISYRWHGGNALKVAHCSNTLCTSATTSASYWAEGTSTSVAIGPDGRGLISFGGTWVAHCNDVFCSDTSANRVDTRGSTNAGTSLAIGVDGRGLVSYYDELNGNLLVVHLPIGY